MLTPSVLDTASPFIHYQLPISEYVLTTMTCILSIRIPLDKPTIIHLNLTHATPIAGYVGEYKILYGIKLQFCWPRLRSDVSDWIKQCAHCMLTYRWRCRGQELVLYWPVSSPFAILHVDLWMPDHHTNPGGYMALMNTMCNMSQFVIVVPLFQVYYL